MTEGTFDPHGHARVLQAGAPLYRAKAAVVMLHGRGSEAGNMLEFAEILAQPDLTIWPLRQRTEVGIHTRFSRRSTVMSHSYLRL
jgi:alpha-beta hydrolase superfamily lysophospholipase